MKGKFMVADGVRSILENKGLSYHANNSIYEAMVAYAELAGSTIGDIRAGLIDELEGAFTDVLYAMVIDRQNDPNSRDTPRRLARMYINELYAGRYYPEPKITAFPNDKPQGLGKSLPSSGDTYHFNNLLVVQSPFISNCSHHHQIVRGVAYVGILPGKKLIGLSKYTRLVQHLAARGTLQEELTIDIAEALESKTDSPDIAVTLFARHGCCENRGIRSPNSQTTTAEMRGKFMTNPNLRKEFYDNVQMLRSESK